MRSISWTFNPRSIHFPSINNEPPKGSKESWAKLTLAYADSAAALDRAAQAKDADVKAFAQKTLPTLQEHLTMAKAMEASVEPTAAGKPAERSADKSTMSKDTSAMSKDKGEKKY